MSALPHRWHDAIVASVVGSYTDPVYVEIGVASCACFNTVAPLAKVAHAVDPSEHALRCIGPYLRAVQWHMPSTGFWARYTGHPDVVFIDGDHTYLTAKRDFLAAAKCLAPGGTILLHDVWPASQADTRPEACGDVYRLADELVDECCVGPATEFGPWRTFLFGRFPGLLLCQRATDNPPWQP